VQSIAYQSPRWTAQLIGSPHDLGCKIAINGHIVNARWTWKRLEAHLHLVDCESVSCKKES